MQSHIKGLLGKLFASASAVVFMGVPAFAQTSGSPAPASSSAATDGQNDGIGDIVVTAQRRSENLQRVPIAVSVISTQSLANFGALSTRQLQNAVPELVVNNTGGISGIFLRGVGTRTFFAGLESSVAVYDDDRYVPGPTAPLVTELLDIERVEVVKGPQGVLYGRNVTGGAVRVISADVTDDYTGYLSGSYGNYNALDLRATVNAPLTDNLGIRIAAAYDRHDGYATNRFAGGRKNWNDKEIGGVRAKIKWEPTANLTIRATGGFWRSDDTAGLGVVTLPPTDLSTSIDNGGMTGRKRSEVSTAITQPHRETQIYGQLRADIDLGFASLASITSYSHDRSSYWYDADGTNIVVSDINTVTRYNAFAQEFQLASNSGQPLEWIVGANYYREKAYGTSILYIPTPFTPIGGQTVFTNTYAGFGQLTYHVLDNLALIAGGRYTYERKSDHVVAIPGATNSNGASLPFHDRTSFKKFTPKAGIQWNYASDGMLFFTYSRGFKSGGFAFPSTPPAVVLKPEVLDSFEIGWKADLLDRTLRFNVSAFHYNYKDLQVSSSILGPDNTPITFFRNATSAKIKGVEGEATWHPSRAWTFTGIANYTSGHYGDFTTIAPAFRIGTPTPGNGLGVINAFYDASGQRLLRLPKFTGSISATYEAEVFGGRMPINVGYSYKSGYDFDFVISPRERSLHQPSYGLLSASIGYATDDGKYKITLFGNNINNKRYFTYRSGSGANGIVGSYGDPRTYGVKLESNF